MLALAYIEIKNQFKVISLGSTQKQTFFNSKFQSFQVRP
jgi:hypothetical protein